MASSKGHSSWLATPLVRPLSSRFSPPCGKLGSHGGHHFCPVRRRAADRVRTATSQADGPTTWKRRPLVFFLAVALVGRRQLAKAKAREAALRVMPDLSREVASATTPRYALDALAGSIRRALGARCRDAFKRAGAGWECVASTTGARVSLSRDEAALALRVVDAPDFHQQ